MDTYTKTYDFVKKIHAGQKYGNNKDYFQSHILEVVTWVKQLGDMYNKSYAITF